MQDFDEDADQDVFESFFGGVKDLNNRRAADDGVHRPGPKTANRDQTLQAVREWYSEHGRPPAPQEWDQAAPGRPSRRTIRRRWGWEQLMAEATGKDPDEVREHELRAHRRQLLLRLRAARDQLGRWPGGREWEQATFDHAARRTYVRNFGSWAAACQEASQLGVEQM